MAFTHFLHSGGGSMMSQLVSSLWNELIRLHPELDVITSASNNQPATVQPESSEDDLKAVLPFPPWPQHDYTHPKGTLTAKNYLQHVTMWERCAKDPGGHLAMANFYLDAHETVVQDLLDDPNAQVMIEKHNRITIYMCIMYTIQAHNPPPPADTTTRLLPPLSVPEYLMDNDGSGHSPPLDFGHPNGSMKTLELLQHITNCGICAQGPKDEFANFQSVLIKHKAFTLYVAGGANAQLTIEQYNHAIQSFSIDFIMKAHYNSSMPTIEDTTGDPPPLNVLYVLHEENEKLEAQMMIMEGIDLVDDVYRQIKEKNSPKALTPD